MKSEGVKKLWEVLREYDVDCRLLRAFKSLNSCSEVCARVGEIKSSTVHCGVDSDKSICLQRSFIVCVNWIDSHYRVYGCVTAGSCRINRLVFAGDLVLIASSQRALQHVLDTFSATCDRKPEWKLSIMSLQKPKSVYAANELHHPAAGKELLVPRCGIHEWP